MSRVLTIRPLIFSVGFSLLLAFCGVRPCAAQQLVPVIELSADEAGKAKQAEERLKAAQERNSKAIGAWQQFHQSYQVAHPDLAPLRFTADFRHAFALRGSPSLLESKPLKAIDLTSDEQNKLQALHREVVDSSRALEEAEANSQNYQYRLVADHVTDRGESGLIMKLDGKQVTIPTPWDRGVAFTPDFRLAVPRQQFAD